MFLAFNLDIYATIMFADMSSTAFIEPLPVIDFVTQLLNRDVTSRPLSDSDRVKVILFYLFPWCNCDHLNCIAVYVLPCC